MHRSLTRSLFTLLLLLLLGAATAQRYEWRDVVQHVTIQPDGDVVVDDTRTLWTNDDFGEAFICVGLEAGQRLTLLPGSGGLGPGPDTTSFSQPCSAGTEVVVKNAQRLSERRVRFVYRISGTTDAYQDVVQWYWNLIQLDHPVILGYELTVDAPGPMSNPFDAYVHRFSNPEQPVVRLSDDRAQLQVRFDRIPAGDGVEIRYLMDPTLFTLTGTQPALARLLADEASVARLNIRGESPELTVPGRLKTSGANIVIEGRAVDPDGIEAVRFDAAGRLGDCVGTDPFRCSVEGLPIGTTTVTIGAVDVAGFRSSRTVTVHRPSLFELIRGHWAWGLVALTLTGGLLKGVFGAYNVHGREPKLETMRYPFEPPSDLPPAAVRAIGMQEFSSSAMGPAFHATIMDLARRGFGTFTPKGKRFEMRLHPETPTDGLLPFEADVLGYLKAAAASKRRGDPTQLEFKELRAYSQSHASRFLPAWGSKVRAWLEQQRGGPLIDPASRKAAQSWALRGLLVTGAQVGGAVLTVGTGRGLFIVGAVLTFALTLIANVTIKSWRKDLAAEVYGWQGFKRTLTDYTRMKNAPLDFFQLWDVYYCYAAALGVADAYLKALGRAAPMAGVDEREMMSRGAWMGATTGSSLASFGSLASSLSSMSSALSAASASASSGGSSSGGGGGGGGGGSSGGR